MLNPRKRFSASVLFRLSGGGLPDKAIISIILLMARDFDQAFVIAKEIGRKKAAAGCVRNNAGKTELKLQFQGVLSLDLVGGLHEGTEVWSSVDDWDGALLTKIKEVPGQTI